jgi:sugar/nucleoside kinase (ribokinase family)
MTSTPREPRFVAVVGTVNFDRIVAESGETFESLGGILYNGLVLAELLEGSGVSIALFARLGEEHMRAARGLFASFPHVDLAGLRADPAGTNGSRLVYGPGGERDENVQLRVAPLDDADLSGIERADAVLVNMISGRDVRVETLEAVRARSAARFFLDVQALARTIESPRTSRLVADWKRWSRIFHTVRGNDAEISWFAGTPGDAEAAAARILEEGPSEVLITRGARGSLRVARGRTGFSREEILPVRRFGPIDSTGCGDSYDAAIVAGFALGLSGRDAARLGSFVGSEVAGVHGLDGILALRGLRRRLAAADPAFAPLATSPRS